MQQNRRPSQRRARVVAFVVLAAGLAGAASAADSYPTIDSSFEPLRSAFNAEPGHVRAVLLASPT